MTGQTTTANRLRGGMIVHIATFIAMAIGLVVLVAQERIAAVCLALIAVVRVKMRFVPALFHPKMDKMI